MFRRLVAALPLLALAACADGPATTDAGSSGGSPEYFQHAADKAQAAAIRQAVENGQPAPWQVHSWVSGTQAGTVAPGDSFKDSAGRPCRTLSLDQDGRARRQVIACQEANGFWVVSEWNPERR